MAAFTNRATLSYNGITTDSNVIVGEILEALSASKTAVDTAPARRSPMQLVNNGTAPLRA